MTMSEKAETLKNSIYQLYSKEGRSKNYISRLLEIDRRTLTDKIREWEFPDPEPVRHMNPSTEKFLNRNRSLIKSRLDNNISVSEIARELGCTRDLINKTLIKVDPVLAQAHRDYMDRVHSNAKQARQNKKDNSRLQYDVENIEGEIWKPLLGYPKYEVSNMGRVRSYAERYKSWYILRTEVNAKSGREYVMLVNENGVRKNMQVANIVAHTFVPGFDKEHNTVNHEDGNVLNNRAENLTWMSQSENSIHAHCVLNRGNGTRNIRKFTRILYQNKYEFKTIKALAKFMGKSKTQTRRYLETPEKYDIQLL